MIPLFFPLQAHCFTAASNHKAVVTGYFLEDKYQRAFSAPSARGVLQESVAYKEDAGGIKSNSGPLLVPQVKNFFLLWRRKDHCRPVKLLSFHPRCKKCVVNANHVWQCFGLALLVFLHFSEPWRVTQLDSLNKHILKLVIFICSRNSTIPGVLLCYKSHCHERKMAGLGGVPCNTVIFT